MIKLEITKFRDFTEEEKKEMQERRIRNGGRFDYDTLTPSGFEKYLEKALTVEITEEQFNAIRKAVLENF